MRSINREEFTPYGETSFGSFARKRYRFTGKETRSESGLYYHGARYRSPWVARWISPDPGGAAGRNEFVYLCKGNPVRSTDLNGMQEARSNSGYRKLRYRLAPAAS